MSSRTRSPQRLILKNFQSPGDIVMLTAAVRDLHEQYPNRFVTDTRTACSALWENNPYITALDDGDSNIRIIYCHYPLIHSSNERPTHFVSGFIEYLNAQLRLNIVPSRFYGFIVLSDAEKSWYSQVHEVVGEDIPFWIIVAGGKFDYTIKWWDHRRYQEVVDYFRDRILFVQVGEQTDYHPLLNNVLDLRGKTDLRQFVRLMFHAQGVLCPVTFPMHLAAAVEMKDNQGGRTRPCVVIAGGREPPSWEAYPHHQFIHTCGALRCCRSGGCWRSRTVPLGDGSENDRPDAICVDVINGLPRCMDLISSRTVIERIEMYFDGGVVRPLSPRELQLARAAVASSKKRIACGSRRGVV
jgi:ADP-heptose:LPS heptosyltransferase